MSDQKPKMDIELDDGQEKYMLYKILGLEKNADETTIVIHF